MGALRNRFLFAVGTAVGATIGIGAAFRSSGFVNRSVRDEFQQSIESLLFRALDMVPFQVKPTDVVTETRPATSSAAYTPPPVDIVLGSRPSEAASGVQL